MVVLAKKGAHRCGGLWRCQGAWDVLDTCARVFFMEAAAFRCENCDREHEWHSHLVKFIRAYLRKARYSGRAVVS